jgi:hypothetical protein
MKVLHYYSLLPPIYSKTTGVLKDEQIYDFSLINYDKRNYWAKYQQSRYHDFIEPDLDLNVFKLHPKAKLTHILSSKFLNNFGLFMSTELYTLFSQYNAYKAKFHKIKLTRNETQVDWYYMQILSSGIELVHYHTSEFVVAETIPSNRTMHSFIQQKVEDYDDFKRINYEVYKKDSNLNLQIKTCVLKNEYDIIVLPFEANVFVSERLMKRLKESKLITWDTLGEFTKYNVFVA